MANRKELKMKKTEYKVMVSYGISTGPKYRRVWEDENGRRYIRESGKYKDIENLPCAKYLTRA